MVSKQKIEGLEVNLAETLDISTVQALYAELRATLDKGTPIILYGTAVTHVDTSALQVLAAMFVYADEHQCELRLESPSDVLVKTAALLGLAAHIGIEVRETA